MFRDKSQLIRHNARQRSYGIAVTDVDGDGQFELFVTGFGSPNRALKWDGTHFVDVADDVLADVRRFAIGVAAADIDADGREEIYILNTDTFAGQKRLADRLFDCRDGKWTDLFEYPDNEPARNLTAGRSVAGVDRNGDGWYGFFVANYGGPMRLYELDEDGIVTDVGPDAGLALTTGGRSVVAGPLLTRFIDIYAANENGDNFLFRNDGNGSFSEVAGAHGVNDPFEHARGVALLDVDGDGRLDIVCGNWEGPHRLFRQQPSGQFEDIAPEIMSAPSRVRTVIAADFDNDGFEELFFNNIGQPNRLFGWRDGRWQLIDIGDALERYGLGTGAAVGDFSGTGRLSLTIAHGESGMQPLSHYIVPDNGNRWLRVLPLTRFGAPARGAVVTVLAQGRTQTRLIDSGSGYLCQMEPVAHFGLGLGDHVEQLTVRWPDGKQTVLSDPPINCLTTVAYHD